MMSQFSNITFLLQIFNEFLRFDGLDNENRKKEKKIKNRKSKISFLTVQMVKAYIF